AELLGEDRAGGIDHRRAARRREVARERDVGEESASRVRFGVEPLEAGAVARRGTPVERAERRAERARSAVDREPERALLVALQLEEVVAAAERRELARGVAL